MVRPRHIPEKGLTSCNSAEIYALFDRLKVIAYSGYYQPRELVFIKTRRVKLDIPRHAININTPAAYMKQKTNGIEGITQV